MFNWVEIGLENNRGRYQELSAFLSENQFPNAVHFIQTTEQSFAKDIELATQQYDGIRIGRGCGEIVLPLFVTHEGMVGKIRAADALAKVGSKWWLRNNAVQGFSRVIAKVGESLDLDSSVLIVGAGAAARVAITSLFIAGFKDFVVSNLDLKKAETMVNEMKTTHLGAHFKLLPKEGLVLLPGGHGVLVNTTPLANDNPMLEELYYFNFFKSGGVAIDFTISPVDTPLLIAARDVGALCVHGFQISAATDILWCEQVTGRSLPTGHYAERLESALRPAKV